MKSRRSWLKIAMLASACCLAIGAASASPPSASASEPLTCNTGYVCAWWNIYWTGAVGYTLCTGGAHPLNQVKSSATNGCPNKAAWLRINGSATGCINPSVKRGIAEFNEIWIGAEGSRC